MLSPEYLHTAGNCRLPTSGSTYWRVLCVLGGTVRIGGYCVAGAVHCVAFVNICVA